MVPTKSPTTLFDLNPLYGVIRVSGPAALSFLQGQLTADIREITPTASRLSGYCTVKGRVRTLFRIFQMQDTKEAEVPTYLLQTLKSLLPNALSELKKVARFSKVTLEDISESVTQIGLQGQLLPLPQTPAMHWVPLSEEKSANRFELIGPKDLILPLWQTWLQMEEIKIEPKIKIENVETWQRLNIRSGIPEVFPETVEQFLPHTLNLPALGAVSFTKGCYCGQEIVARMEYRGKLKRGSFYARIDKDAARDLTLPSPGSKIYRVSQPEEAVGTLIYASFGLNQDIEMLIECLDIYPENGEPLMVITNNTPIHIRVN